MFTRSRNPELISRARTPVTKSRATISFRRPRSASERLSNSLEVPFEVPLTFGLSPGVAGSHRYTSGQWDEKSRVSCFFSPSSFSSSACNRTCVLYAPRPMRDVRIPPSTIYAHSAVKRENVNRTSRFLPSFSAHRLVRQTYTIFRTG